MTKCQLNSAPRQDGQPRCAEKGEQRSSTGSTVGTLDTEEAAGELGGMGMGGAGSQHL